MASNLKRYKAKRDFTRTGEPEGHVGPSSNGRSFVIQKHAARRLHYDLRLEHAGVLLSWAVPKGPSLDPKERRLAVHVEDHPVDYGGFEGTIPTGQYGGGTVMLWDRGVWEPVGDPTKGLRSGRLKFRLHGDKLSGGWALIRICSNDEDDANDNWLLIKEDDEHARPSDEYEVTGVLPDSVDSNRTMEEIAATSNRVWQSNREEKQTPKSKKNGKSKTPAVDAGAIAGARKKSSSAAHRPQLATLSAVVPEGDDWLHEVKFDGYRLLAHVSKDAVTLITRNGNDWTRDMPGLADALQGLNLGEAVLDGEVVALRSDGTSDFQLLQNTIKSGNTKHLIYYVFDVVSFGGYDLTKSPLLERKRLLEAILTASPTQRTIRYSDHIVGNGEAVFDEACRHGLEGIISKRVDAGYEQRRTRRWLKVKCVKRQEFVIGGYTDPSGAREHFGALLLGYYENDSLVYCGKVGTGFTDATLKELMRELKPRAQKTPPFHRPPPRKDARGAHWVAPELVGEVEFTEWTSEGILRHPSFKGLRSDKPPASIRRERAANSADVEAASKKGRVAEMEKTIAKKSEDARIAGIVLSNPDKVLYPEQGVTKLDLAHFYEAVADWILPYVANRPLTIVRCPQGRAKKCFYQKHLNEGLPDALTGVKIPEKEGSGLYVTLSDLSGLIALVQVGALEIHPWGSRNDAVEKPDMLTMDLDPGPDVPWGRVIEAANTTREVLAEAGLESFVKTTGGKGLHVVVPIDRRSTWDEAKGFAKAVAARVSETDPKSFVTVMTKAKRTGKIYVDYLRNGRGATAIAAYSTRAREGAPVATPLRWDELSERTPANAFTVENLPKRLSAVKADPWEGFFQVRQSLTKKAQKAVGMEV